MWWMIGTSLLLLPLMRSGARLARWEGVVLVGVYVAYLIVLLR
jgi:cation:H+ antiporter